MVEINIDKDYRLVSDNYGWVLQKKRVVGESDKGKQPKKENIGQEVWADDGYYSSLNGLFKGYLSKKARRSDATSFRELMGVVNETQVAIDNISKQLKVN